MQIEEVTKQEAKKHLEKLADDARIIVVTANNQLPVVLLKHAETLVIGQTVYKFLRNASGLIVTVWIASLSLFPEITPTPIQVYKTIEKNIPEIIARIDFSFPLPNPDEHKPWLQFLNTLPDGTRCNGATYYVSVSGVAPQYYNFTGAFS